MVCTLLAGVNVVAFAADGDETVSVSKFYNDAKKGGDGEHLFTKDADEMSWLSSLPTWNNQGEAWKAPVSSSLAVYRVYNPNSGEHHYAAADEASWLVGQGWTQEKIAFYSDDNMGVPVYRLWNGLDGVGSHYYTTDEGEAAWLASIGWQAEGVNFYGVKEEEPGEKEMVATQTGSKEITVVSETEFTGAEEFTVMKGAVEQSVAAVDFDDDMCTVTLSMDGNISEAEYTVICSDLEYEPASFTGEVGKLSYIFIGENLISMGQQPVGNSGATINVYAVGYKTMDQWFNDYNVTSFDSSVCSAGTVLSVKDGMMTVGTENPLTIGTQQTVSLVKGTVVGTQTVTVSATSVVADMTVGELTATAAEAKINTTGRIDVEDVNANNRYYFPIAAKDQYGNDLDARTLNMMTTAGSLIVSPDNTGNGVLTAAGTTGNIFTKLDDGSVAMFVEGDGTSYGKALINLVSTSGEVENATADIVQNERIEDITFITASSTLQEGKPVGAAVIAMNNYGELVDMYNDVTVIPTMPLDPVLQMPTEITFRYTPENKRAPENGSKIKLTNAGIGWEDDATDETRVFGVVGKDSAQSATVTVYSANGTKVSPFVYTVEKAATPDAIKGLTDSAAQKKTTFAAVGQTIDVALTDLVFIDSDGDVIAQDKQANYGIVDLVAEADDTTAVTNQYYVVATSVDDKIDVDTSVNGVTLDSTGADAGKTYKVNYALCKKGATSDTVVAEKSISYKIFNAADTNMTYTTQVVSTSELPKYLIYVGEDADVYEDTAIIKLYQTDSNGATIPMSVTGVSVSGGNFTSAVTGGAIKVATVTATEELAQMGTATVNIFANVNGASKKVATATLAYDVVEPTAMSTVILDDEFNSVEKTSFSNVTGISGGAGCAFVTETKNAVDKHYTLFVVDQYSNVDEFADWTFNGEDLPMASQAPTEDGILSVDEDGVSQDWTVTIP